MKLFYSNLKKKGEMMYQNKVYILLYLSLLLPLSLSVAALNKILRLKKDIKWQK